MTSVVTAELFRLQAAVAERYVILRELGRGGTAHVYLAHDVRHERDVALKVLRPDIAASLGTERFLREIRIVAALQHPHILPLHDSGTADGLLYYVMPFVEGETLRGRLAREKQLPLADALRIAREVADALGYAHGHNIVHRDIKPGNILLSAGHAVVADFGIAHAITAAAGDQVTEPGLAFGTPAYMSPEQATGDSQLDGRTDVYALGCVLYEMVAGEPPFQGRTMQAILARQLHDEPPSLRNLRANLPPSVEQAVMTALAKVPADRFTTAAEFAEALEAEGSRTRRRWSHQRKVRVLGTTAALVLAGVLAVGLWRTAGWPRARLDTNRVMVFPLNSASSTGVPEGAGEGVATYIGYALEGTAPLRWLEARDFLGDREDGTPLARADAQRVARAQRAGFYIDGSVLAGPESVTVVLRLHDVEGDSVIRRAGASSRSSEASLPQLGLRAVGDLLPALLEPGRRVDLTALSARRPTAIAHFLQGEREYRRMRFNAALGHYRKAVADDSALAIAALKGAAAAYWKDNRDEAAELIAVALDREADLPPRLALFARGLRSTAAGQADSAVDYLNRALAGDSNWAEAWMALGEVHYHLLPRVSSPDSLAEAAFTRAQRVDSTFAPPLFHLTEIALRRRDLPTAERYLARLRLSDPDSTFIPPLSLMYGCVRDGPAGIRWREAAEGSPMIMLEVAWALAARGANPACARAGFSSVLSASREEHRWGALLGLQGLLAAMGRDAEVDSLLRWAEAKDLPGRLLYLLDAAAGPGFERQAAAAATQLGQTYDSVSSLGLWFLGEWEARQGGLPSLVHIADVMTRRAATSGDRTDSLVARTLQAQMSRRQGDSAQAIALLRRLTPAASQADLSWQPWEAFAGERLALAELLLASGHPADADSVVSELDSHRAIVYLVYLPAVLELKARAAEALGRPGMAAANRSRLAALRRELPSSAAGKL
jgi:tRNA A-37 threonylcarbamoyl transferase component Bud32/tetratricopeptide (TPR) repeat protein